MAATNAAAASHRAKCTAPVFRRRIRAPSPRPWAIATSGRKVAKTTLANSTGARARRRRVENTATAAGSSAAPITRTGPWMPSALPAVNPAKPIDGAARRRKTAPATPDRP